MQYITSVTSKGQATIPAPVRKKLGIKPGQKIFFKDQGNQIVIEPAVDVDSLYGSLKTNKKWDKQKAHEAVGKMLTERYFKTLKDETS